MQLLFLPEKCKNVINKLIMTDRMTINTVNYSCKKDESFLNYILEEDNKS